MRKYKYQDKFCPEHKTAVRVLRFNGAHGTPYSECLVSENKTFMDDYITLN